MFRDEPNPILGKNHWDELTLEEQKEVVKGFEIEYSSIARGTFDPIYLTAEEKDYGTKFFSIHNYGYAKSAEDYNEVREILLELYKISNGVD